MHAPMKRKDWSLRSRAQREGDLLEFLSPTAPSCASSSRCSLCAWRPIIGFEANALASMRCLNQLIKAIPGQSSDMCALATALLSSRPEALRPLHRSFRSFAWPRTFAVAELATSRLLKEQARSTCTAQCICYLLISPVFVFIVLSWWPAWRSA